mmetsp:Transcript_14317/g.20847  ORF Transcript_14317/g.20847 Transcript_14317/m.20847 type:complete len:378 (-) Transcript_14317:38-1171(-)
MLKKNDKTREPPSNYSLQTDDSDIHLDSCYCLKFDAHHDLGWQDLQKLEESRREILKRAELPFWRILAYWSGTCLKALALDWLIWLTFAIFLSIRIQARTWGYYNVPALVELLSKTDTSILGGFLSFFLVLFVNQTNSRFFEMYQLSKASSGKIQDVAGLVSSQLPSDIAKRIIRHMNAAHVVGYVGLGGPYTKTHFFDHINAEHHLLTQKELEQIAPFDMQSGSAAFKHLTTLCQRDVTSALKAGYIDSHESTFLHERILEFRAAMDGIYDYTDQPVHFFYIHFLCLLSALYLPLFAIDNAYAAGWGAGADWHIELLYGIIVMLQCIFVVGLRLLGQKMIDPFGDDLEDLSVITYIETTIEGCKIIMNANRVLEVD